MTTSTEMSTFQDRKKALFDQLNAAEEDCKLTKPRIFMPPPDCGVMDRGTYRKIKGEMKKFRGKESIYKRAEQPLNKCLPPRQTPEFIKNPSKWKYYSLEDVTLEQMSETTNAATAAAFLKKVEEGQNMSGDHASDVKPKFLVSATVKTNKEGSIESKITYKNNKVIMPEYVVGRDIKKEKKLRPIHYEKACIKSTLKLDHLFEDDE